MVGRHWKAMWEDGQAGIYKLASSSSTQVKRKHELMDSDGMQLVDGLIDKTLEYARKSVLGDQQKTAGIVNTPKMLRTAALKNVLDDLDGLETEAGLAADDDGRKSAVAPAQAMCRSHVPTPARNNPDEMATSATHGRMSAESIFEALKPCVPQAGGKPDAKQRPKAKAKPSSANKRAAADETPGETETKRSKLVVSLEPPKPSGSGTSKSAVTGVTDAISEADKQWLATHKDNLLDVMKVILADDSDGSEQQIKKTLAECGGKATKLLTGVRARKRSLKRRTAENGEVALNDATEIEDVLVAFTEFVKLLQRPAATSCRNIGDLCYSKVGPLEEQGAKFSPSIYTQIARLMWSDDLKWKRWASMSDVTYKFIERSCPHMDSLQFMVQNMNVSLQKLLKSVMVDEAGRLEIHVAKPQFDFVV